MLVSIFAFESNRNRLWLPLDPLNADISFITSLRLWLPFAFDTLDPNIPLHSGLGLPLWSPLSADDVGFFNSTSITWTTAHGGYGRVAIEVGVIDRESLRPARFGFIFARDPVMFYRGEGPTRGIPMGG
jgi:hypothetical protein